MMSADQNKKCFICDGQNDKDFISLDCCDKWFHRECINNALKNRENSEKKDEELRRRCPSCSQEISEKCSEALKSNGDMSSNDESTQASSFPVTEEQQHQPLFTLRSQQQFKSDADRLAARTGETQK